MNEGTLQKLAVGMGIEPGPPILESGALPLRYYHHEALQLVEVVVIMIYQYELTPHIFNCIWHIGEPQATTFSWMR